MIGGVRIDGRRNILVTGGAGYLGSVLVPELLSQGYQVTVLDNLRYQQQSLLDCCIHDNFDFVKGDISDFRLVNELLPKFDVLIPLAALVGAPVCEANPSLAKLINREAHMNIVSNVVEGQKIIFPTTNSGYGIGDANKLCTEESPLRPISTYGKDKVEIEKAFLDTGNAISYRLATVFGMSPRMRMDLLVNDFVYRAVRDRCIVLFEGHFRRNYIHVRDVAGAFCFAIKNFFRMVGESYNVGLSSANLTKLQLCELIREHIPELLIESADIGEDPDKRDYIVSNRKIESLGWAPKYSLDDGIRELIKGYEIIKPNIFTNN